MMYVHVVVDEEVLLELVDVLEDEVDVEVLEDDEVELVVVVDEEVDVLVVLEAGCRACTCKRT